MSDSFLLAVTARARDHDQLDVSDPSTAAVAPSADALAKWKNCGHLREADNWFGATSSNPGCQGLCLASDGDTFVTRCYEGDDEKVGIYSVKHGALRPLSGHTEIVSALSLDGDRLASGAADGTARLWELSSGRCFARADVGEAVRGVALCGNFLVTGDATDTATLWQLGDGDPTRLWKGFTEEQNAITIPTKVGKVGHEGSVYCVAVLATGSVASVGWNARDLKLWGRSAGTGSAAMGAVHHVVTLPAAAGFAMSRSGESVYVGLRSGHIVAYGMRTGEMERIFAANTMKSEVSALAARFLPGRGTVLAVGNEHAPQLRLCLVPEGRPATLQAEPKLILSHDAHHVVTSIAVSERSGIVLTAGTEDGELEAWTPEGEEEEAVAIQ